MWSAPLRGRLPPHPGRPIEVRPPRRRRLTYPAPREHRQKDRLRPCAAIFNKRREQRSHLVIPIDTPPRRLRPGRVEAPCKPRDHYPRLSAIRLMLTSVDRIRVAATGVVLITLAMIRSTSPAATSTTGTASSPGRTCLRSLASAAVAQSRARSPIVYARRSSAARLPSNDDPFSSSIRCRAIPRAVSGSSHTAASAIVIFA